jgi:hypothetical protein
MTPSRTLTVEGKRRNSYWFVALVLIGGLVAPACTRNNPSESACAAEWNRPANDANQREAASAGFDQAIVYGWTVKSGDAGCSVTLVRDTGARWITYSGLIAPPLQGGAWDRQDGKYWGTDNPGGGPTVANARLLPVGTVDPS